MSKDSSFNLAVKYIHQKQYQKAESIFQNLIKSMPFNENLVLYYGYSLIEQNKYEEALSIYRQYLPINSDKYRLLRAFCYAKMGFLEKSLSDWLKLSKEGNKIAANILSDLKKAKDNKTFTIFLKYNKACGPLPSIKSKDKNKKLLLKENSFFDYKGFIDKYKLFIIFSILVIISIVISTLFLTNIKDKKTPQDFQLNYDSNKSKNYNVPVTTIYLYKDNKQVEKDISIAKKYIAQLDYNNSLLILNKIMMSNAEQKYKDKAKNLTNLLAEPFYNKLSYNPTFNEVLKNPLLYLNLFVQWKGIIYELIDELNFSIMIYSKNPIYIDGIAKCILPKSFPLFVKQQIEIFGKIIDIKENKTPIIEIKNIKVIYE